MDYETLRNSMTVQDATRVLRDTNCYGTMDIAKNVILKVLDEQISNSEKPNKWIPVSERLPENRENILFSTKTDRVFEGRYFDDNTDHQWYSFRDEIFVYNNIVTAWMPLPTSYKAESEE